MMNAGVIPPEQGYLEGVREIVHAHGALLAFDEVKCGVTTAYGGATGYLGVSPDMVCLAKAMGGGVPCGAIGGTEEVMGRIADGTYEQVGTFNGNPLTMAAARATLTEILTPEAYEHFDRLGRDHGRMARGPSSKSTTSPPTRSRSGPRVPSPSPAAGSATTGTSWSSTTVSARRTGSSSTTAASSCRRGARPSSGRSRCSTPRTTPGASSTTSRPSRGR